MMNPIPIPGAEIYYEEHFLRPDEATEWLNTLLSKCAWERGKAPFGYAVPRDEACYGDPGTQYTYSRREYNPLPWIPEGPHGRSHVKCCLYQLVIAEVGLQRRAL